MGVIKKCGIAPLPQTMSKKAKCMLLSIMQSVMNHFSQFAMYPHAMAKYRLEHFFESTISELGITPASFQSIMTSIDAPAGYNMASLLSSELKSTNERTYCKDRIIHIAYLLCEYGQNEPALKSMVEDALSNDVLPYLR